MLKSGSTRLKPSHAHIVKNVIIIIIFCISVILIIIVMIIRTSPVSVQLRLLSCSYSLCKGACGVGGGVFVPACPVPARPTWCSPVYSKSFRPGRSMCRTRPGTGCTRRISDRQRATPGPGRPAGCTGRGSGSRSPRTETPAASLEEQDTWHSVHNGPLNKEDCQITLQPLLPINNSIAIIINYCHYYYLKTWRKKCP